MTTCAICRRPDPAGAYACAACTRHIRATLTELRHQLVLLRAMLQPGASPRAGTTTGGRATAPLPARADVLSLLGPAPRGPIRGPRDDQTGPTPMLAVLQDWAQHTAREHATVAGRPRWPTLGTIEHCLDYLTARLDWACTQPWIADLAGDLTGLRRRVRAITRTEPRTRNLATPCICGAFGLVETDWAEYIECAVCERLLTADEYRQHTATALPPLVRLGLLMVASSATAAADGPAAAADISAGHSP